jgi:glycosyltransferase involved in cell wall biosynthesis
MRQLAFIGNSLPRLCGIATFTTDLQRAVADARSAVETSIVAMNEQGSAHQYPSVVRWQIAENRPGEYLRAADALNAQGIDAVSLQHEFGIFGGPAGSHIAALLDRLTMPIVTTLHTVLARPTAEQRYTLDRVVAASAKVVVMSEKGRELLRNVFQVAAEKIEVIPHGIPDVPFTEPDEAKCRLGFNNRSVILTFGLLSPNKGIEVAIDAMPAILQGRPDAVYVVLGATHPNLIRHQGECYREGLIERAKELGVENHVVFLNQFVDRRMLLDFISMCDVYVTPYLSEAQLTSGTLAYSYGSGKAVVATPYWHAQELLADGRGVLVPFGNATAVGTAIRDLLTDDRRRNAMRVQAYTDSRLMTWEHTAERYLAVFEKLAPRRRLQLVRATEEAMPSKSGGRLPDVRTGHLRAMCDDTGLFQHAVHLVPDRSHGYCVDDNARGLLLACALSVPGEECLPESLTAHFAAFVQHAWNPTTRRFRNFLGFDRRWLEEMGSEDSHGRALWALGVAALKDTDAARKTWAAGLFAAAFPAAESFESPRAWAFALLGLDAYCSAQPSDVSARRLQRLLADRLVACLTNVSDGHWVWFEEGLAYDNARLSEALIVTGLALGASEYVEAGLRSLRWLMTLQVTEAGHFRPIGTDSFRDRRSPPEAFDQQPLEAAATISACLAAWLVDNDDAWRAEAARTFDWFLGGNDLDIPVVDVETGSCRDGLHRDRPNENCGGESVLAYLLSLAEMRQAARRGQDRTRPSPLPARRAWTS